MKSLIKISLLLGLATLGVGCGDQQQNSPNFSGNELLSNGVTGEWILLSVDNAIVAENDSALLLIVDSPESLNDDCAVGRIIAQVTEDHLEILSDGTSQGGCFVTFAQGSNHFQIANALETEPQLSIQDGLLVMTDSNGRVYRFARLNS